MRGLLVALCLAVVPLANGWAQARPRLEIHLPPPAAAPLPRPVGDTGAVDPPDPAPSVRGIDLLADRQTQELLRNGFPARLHFRLDLWLESGLFNQREGTREWDVVVRYEPLTKSYRAARILSSRVTLLGDFDNINGLTNALAAPLDVSLSPMHRGEHYYYNAVVDVETLSLRDLDEVEKWLHGDLQPAIRGQRAAGTAVGNGLRTLFLRLIGSQRRHYEARSKTFTA